MDLRALEKWFSNHRETIFQDLFHFLKFKSIGTDPAFDADTKACAHWLVDYLKKSGMETTLWETSVQPVIFAKHCKAPGRPTLLIYQHYDVQPVDPINLWETDPFEPTVRNGEVYARGAQDNKGQCFYSITAVKALLQLCDQLNFNLKIFIEGEEEGGSEGTRAAIEAHKDALSCDYILVVDSTIPNAETPAITLGIRGIITMEMICKGADVDMHSGTFGGAAYNPIRALVTALSSCWDPTGKVAVPHFYDSVKKMSAAEMNNFALEMDEDFVKKEFGLRLFGPEPGYSIGQSVGIRPTVEINGIEGGYTGEGFKTVLPATAKAKISCRLVPNQDPDSIISELQAHLLKNVPSGMEVTFTDVCGYSSFIANRDSLIAKHAAKAYEEVMGKPCKNVLSGGSIPIVMELAKASGGEAVMMGYGLDSDQIHAPNEHFGLDRFEKGFLTMGRILALINEEA